MGMGPDHMSALRRLLRPALGALALGLAAPALASPTPGAPDGGIGAKQLNGLGYSLNSSASLPGEEAMLLQARAANGGALIEESLHWRLTRLLPFGGQELAAEGDSAAFLTPAEPGEYRVEITYGLARLVQQIKLGQGRQIAVTFTLDVGALELVEGASAIYGTSGANRGRLLAEAAPDTVLTLPAGTYRIESDKGQAEVKVKPGIVSRIGTKPGLAQILVPKATQTSAAGPARLAE